MKPGLHASVVLLVAMGVVSTAHAMEPPHTDYDHCVEESAEFSSASLTDLWTAASEIEPGYDAAEHQISAQQMLRQSLDRQRHPTLQLHAEGDGGKRVSPGAERDQGVSARAETGASLDWLWYDSAHRWRQREAQLRQRHYESTSSVFDAEYRGQITRAYVEASFETARYKKLRRQVRRLDELAELVEHRIDAGVETEHAKQQLDQAMLTVERNMSEARQSRDAAIIHLSSLVGDCATAQPIGADAPAPEHIVDELDEPTQIPALDAIQTEAEATSASAEVSRRDGRLELRTIGAGSLYFSGAYDNFPEPEYFAGLSGVFRPDLSGTRSRLADAETQQARALEFQAQSLRREVLRQYHQLKREVAESSERLEELHTHLESATQHLESTRMRWSQGVSSWLEVIDAKERHQQLQLEYIALQRDITHSVIDYAKQSGDFSSVLQLTNQTGIR